MSPTFPKPETQGVMLGSLFPQLLGFVSVLKFYPIANQLNLGLYLDYSNNLLSLYHQYLFIVILLREILFSNASYQGNRLGPYTCHHSLRLLPISLAISQSSSRRSKAFSSLGYLPRPSLLKQKCQLSVFIHHYTPLLCYFSRHIQLCFSVSLLDFELLYSSISEQLLCARQSPGEIR